MKLLPQNIPKTIVLPALAITLLLCGIARLSGCGKARPRLTMAKLDAEAQKYIDQANAGIPRAVGKLCKNRTKLFWLVMKDRCSRRHRAERYIASVIEPDVLTPLRKAAAIYACAVDKDASVEMVAEAAKDNLDRQIYAFAGLAIEAVFVKATVESCLRVLGSCAPRLAASWGLAGTCAVADGPLPIGDIIGVALAAGGTIWCSVEIHRAYKALPAYLTSALQNAVAATVAHCRLEAASAL